jgi:PAS domain S-box-containing protein
MARNSCRLNVDVKDYRKAWGLCVLRLNPRQKVSFMIVVRKQLGQAPRELTEMLDSCVNGMTLADPDIDDEPVIYVNRAFETMSEYSRADVIGRNCRFMQNEDRDQPEREILLSAIRRREQVQVTLRNYKKSGKLFYNRLVLQPLFDPSGRLAYYLGVQYDVTEQVHFNREIHSLSRQLSAGL